MPNFNILFLYYGNFPTFGVICVWMEVPVASAEFGMFAMLVLFGVCQKNLDIYGKSNILEFYLIKSKIKRENIYFK